VDVALLRKSLKAKDVPFTIGWLHVVSRSANAVPEFRQRIREGAPIEHPCVHPGVTVLCEGDVFRFRFVTYFDCLDRFAPEAAEEMEMVRLLQNIPSGGSQSGRRRIGIEESRRGGSRASRS